MKLRNYRFANAFVFVLALRSLAPIGAVGQQIEWIRQYGTSGFDGSYSVVADGLGNAYVTGSTTGNVGGPNAGSRDGFVRKYDSTGGLLWSRQFGTSSSDESLAIAFDNVGGVYVSGTTDGSLGGPSHGLTDAFLSKLDTVGNIQWTQQLGSGAGDYGWHVAADSLGNVFLSGHTFGNLGGPNLAFTSAFVSKYDSAGTLAWTRQFGTSSDNTAVGSASDRQGGVYVSGVLNGFVGYVSHFDSSGTQVWQQTLNVGGQTNSSAVAVDEAGNVLVLGNTVSPRDVFLSKYNSSGTLLWRQFFGSAGDDYGDSLSLDGLGNIYIAGQTDGVLGESSAGGTDTFLTSFDSSGQFRWTRQFGTAQSDSGRGVSADGFGNIFIAGSTTGALGVSSAGSTDAFVVKITNVPEPTAVCLAVIALAAVLSAYRDRAGTSVSYGQTHGVNAERPLYGGHAVR